MDVEMKLPPSADDTNASTGDAGADILARLQFSSSEEDQHLCAAVAATVQTLGDQGIAPTPVAYFGAVAASVDRLSRDPSSAPPHVVAALLAFLDATLDLVPAAVVKSRGAVVAESVLRALSRQALPECGVRDGLKCLSHLIAGGDRSRWEAVLPHYSAVLSFATDHRPMVRKQAHLTVEFILQSFQKHAIVVPASDTILRIFERYLLLASGSNSATADAAEAGPGSALDTLCLLEALRNWLPLMSSKSTNAMLKYFKPLLGLNQSKLTRNILDILRAILNSPTSGLNPELLLDLLCSLGVSVSSEQKSGDELASIARLLNVGTKKVYDTNRTSTVVKLPLIFNSVGGILACGHREAIFASSDAFKGLINTCIDERLVEQGVNQIKARLHGAKSGPTVIEKICVTLEGLLDVQYASVWGMSLDVLALAFDRIGEQSFYLMADALKNVVDMQNLSEDDFPYRKQLHACIGSGIAAMGPKNFLNVLEVQNIDDENSWLLPIMKHHIIGAEIACFSSDFLSMIRSIQRNIPELLRQDKLFSAKRAEGYVFSLWSLLPSFCNYPRDTASSFGALHVELCKTLQHEPEFRSLICSSLQTLIQQNESILSGLQKESVVCEDELITESHKRAVGRYTREVAEENLKVLRSFSSELLGVLRSVFLEGLDSIEVLQPAILAIASISDKKVVSRLFVDTMRKLLKATQEANNQEQSSGSSPMEVDGPSDSISITRVLLMEFAASLRPGLGPKEIDLVFDSIKCLFQHKNSLIQKRAYKILSLILKDSNQFLDRNLDVVVNFMISSLPCQFPSKRYRLDCLYYLIVYILKGSAEMRKKEIVSSFLTEILLALKEPNKKTRNIAYDLLVEIGHACEKLENDEKKENLHQYFGMVAGGLTGQTPFAISAAVTGLARLTYEFSELIGVAYKLLPSAFLLLQRPNREVVKANLGFIKALVVKSKADVLHEHLSGMVEGLLNWKNDTKKSFRAKVKLLIQLLVNKCGLNAVKAVMPEEHMKLLTNIRKLGERKKRKSRLSDDGESLASKTTLSRGSRWNHTRIFSDFSDDDGATLSRAQRTANRCLKSSRASSLKLRHKRKRQGDRSLEELIDSGTHGDPLDLLDQRTMRLALHSMAHGRKNDASDDEPEIDLEGRIVVQDDKNRSRSKPSSSHEDIEIQSFGAAQSNGKSSARGQKRRKTSEAGWSYAGTEYKSRKAGGDVKRKGKMEPYAYWPLDRKLLNRRSERRIVARKGMASIMKDAKRLEGKSALTAAVSAEKFKRKGKLKSGGKRTAR